MGSSRTTSSDRQGEGAGDGDALPFASGERGRVTERESARQTDLREQSAHRLRPPPRRADAVHVEGEPERGADGAPGVEGGERVLLDELDEAPVRKLAPGRQQLAAEADLPRVRRIDAEDEVRDRALAGTGFADDGKAFARGDVERDVGGSSDPAALDPELPGHAAQREERWAHAVARPIPAAPSTP